MDEANAHLMEFCSDAMETTSIGSVAVLEEKESSINFAERPLLNKGQLTQAAYYGAIAGAVETYGIILLFGPTAAKRELFYRLKANKYFLQTRIQLVEAQKMTGHQQHAFVREYFSKQ